MVDFSILNAGVLSFIFGGATLGKFSLDQLEDLLGNVIAIRNDERCPDWEMHFANCKRLLGLKLRGSAISAELTESVKAAGVFFRFKYSVTKTAFDEMMIKVIETIAVIPKHAKEGVYFARSAELDNYLLSLFDLFPTIGTIGMESYEMLAINIHMNLMLLLFEYSGFTKSCCRTSVFELLDAFSPFSGKVRRLQSGSTSNYYKRNYIAFMVIMMRRESSYKPPANKPNNQSGNGPKTIPIDYSILQPIPVKYMNDRLLVRNNIHLETFFGNLIIVLLCAHIPVKTVIYMYRMSNNSR